VERDVVVDDEDRPRAVLVSVAYVGDHAVKRVGVKIPPAHFDDRTEAAIVGAPARGLDHVYRPAKYGVALQHPGVAIGQLYLATFESVYRTVLSVIETVAASIREPRDMIEAALFFNRAQDFAEGDLAFASHDEVNYARRVVSVGFRREA